jgi:hypothetical protein
MAWRYFMIEIICVNVGRKAELQRDLRSAAGLDTSGASEAQIPEWQKKQVKAIINALYDKNYPPLRSIGIETPGGYNANNNSYSAYLPQVEQGPAHITPAPAQLQEHTANGSSGRPKGSKTVRCICLNTGTLPDMIQCTKSDCGVWQHVRCLGKDTAKGKEGSYLCELCRILLADPFWKPTQYLLPTSKMKELPGMAPIKDLKGRYQSRLFWENTFFVNQQDLRKCQTSDSGRRINIVSLKLEDNIPCRLHWPKNISFRINHLSAKPYTRGSSTELGINQRDKAVNASSYVISGRNTVNLSAVENDTWVISVHIAEKQSKDSVKAMMKTPETLEEAKQRMKTLLSGDSEDALGLEQMSFSLKDPLTCTRMITPARFDDASGPQAFDLDSFLSIAELNRKWQDPTTLKNSIITNLRVDAYVEKILKVLESYPNVSNIEVNADGDWRPEGFSNGWFDICQDLLPESSLLQDFVKKEACDAKNDDETEDFENLSAIDGEMEAIEGMSALITVGKLPQTPSSAHPPSKDSVTGQKRGAVVEVIDLLSSDDD